VGGAVFGWPGGGGPPPARSLPANARMSGRIWNPPLRRGGRCSSSPRKRLCCRNLAGRRCAAPATPQDRQKTLRAVWNIFHTARSVIYYC